MNVVYFVEDNSVVLSQLLENIPTENEPVKIKGRKGKVIGSRTTEDNITFVYVSLEKKLKNQPVAKEKKKR